MNDGVRGANWATGRWNRVLIKRAGSARKGGFLSGDFTRVPLWKPGHKPWTFSLLPDPELRLLYADTIANGASVWMGITPFELEQPEMKTLAAMNRFLSKER